MLWRIAGLPFLLVVAFIVSPEASARDGGGFRGGGGGGGGFRAPAMGGGGGSYRFSAPRRAPAPVESAPIRTAPIGDARPDGGGSGFAERPQERGLEQGYSGAHPLYGANTRSHWTGHNISQDQYRRFNQNGWDTNRENGFFGQGRSARQIDVDNNFYNRDYGGWSDSWSNGGYWGSRPWAYGWYNWQPDSWGWWGGSSVGWGLAALAGADVITGLLDAAAEQQSPVIDVPDSNYQLNYGTVDSVGSSGADFSYAVAGSPPIQGAANCQQGLLDGQVPSTASQAQLLNAACQVAYGPDPKGTPLPESLAGRLPSWLRELLVFGLGAGLAVGGWQLLERQRQQHPPGGSGGHHPTVTSG